MIRDFVLFWMLQNHILAGPIYAFQEIYLKDEHFNLES